MDATNLRYLQLLSKSFPTAAEASAEIVNLSAVLNLPKGTEFFASDIHGEYEAFSHILRNGSGTIRLKLDDIFADELSDAEKRSLATLIYYPEQKMELLLPEDEEERHEWFITTIMRLIAVCRWMGRKYTRSKVRKSMPKDFAYIIEELMTEYRHGEAKDAYYEAIIDAVLSTGRARSLVVVLCYLIQRLSIDHLHIVGDIYDRGPEPDTIVDALMQHHSIDIQWGNHDIVWMGASQGQRGCIAHVVRQCARYGNLSILEDSYGINIMPLAGFVNRVYADDPCVAFGLKGNPQLSEREYIVNVRIQKAMTIIQFKVEGQLIDENPSFGLEDRKLLEKIDYEKGTVTVDGIEYELTDKVFPTIDPADPYRLTDEEERIMQRLEQSFRGSEKLQRHMKFLLRAGGLYKVHNGNLLMHACVPLNDDGSLKEVQIFEKTLKGRALYEEIDRYVRAGFYEKDPVLRKRGLDIMWWLWLGEGSPLFAKSKMATFERYLTDDKVPQKEVKNPFYTLMNQEGSLWAIYEDFNLGPESRIVCGHVPVKAKDGEDPVKYGGKVICIDGGFSKAYQPTTGIAGYTLISNSYGFVLAAHEPLESAQAAIENEIDIYSSRRVVERVEKRCMVADTDDGARLKAQITDLKALLEAFNTGLVAERR